MIEEFWGLLYNYKKLQEFLNFSKVVKRDDVLQRFEFTIKVFNLNLK